MAESKHLQLTGVIGFNGQVRKGFILHPDDKHVVYPLGSTIVVRNLLKNNQHFLHKDGHDQNVSCLAISSSGKYLASGQETHMGFLATVIVWNLETCEIVHKLKLHKGKIQDVCFSHDEQYLATLGGIDDNRVVVWEVVCFILTSVGYIVCSTLFSFLYTFKCCRFSLFLSLLHPSRIPLCISPPQTHTYSPSLSSLPPPRLSSPQ